MYSVLKCLEDGVNCVPLLTVFVLSWTNQVLDPPVLETQMKQILTQILNKHV